MTKNILVIGGTGNVGRHVVAQLPAAKKQVRALVRNPDAACLPPTVELVRGDLTLPETLDAGLRDVDTVFLVWTAPPDAFVPALDRIARHARRIVFLSAPLKTRHPLFQQPNPSRALAEHHERLIERSGLEWTYLRPGMLAANALGWWAPQTRLSDVVQWPHLAAPTAPVDERDIAAVAVRALTGEGQAGKEYVLTGPESLTQFEQISTVGKAIGREFRIKEVSPEEWRPAFPAPIRKMLLDAWAAAIGQPAYVTSAVEEITGSPARTFLQWATDHAGEFCKSASVVPTIPK
jgi:uncharacterized protein YbjT (DUF2867 family)